MNHHKQDAATIKDRLFDAFPAGSYCIPALLSVANIEESKEVQTACVECCARPRLMINPDFVREHAPTPEKLMMLVMHELHHIVLGHTRLYPRITQIDNIVFDAIINSMLCSMFPQHEYTSMFTDFYKESSFPECLLRPPPKWKPGVPARLHPDVYAIGGEKLAEVYRRLYSNQGATYEEVREVLVKIDPSLKMTARRLLGDHRPEGMGASSSGDLESRSPELFEEIRRMVEHWPLPPDPIRGRARKDLIKVLSIKTTSASNLSELIRMLRRIADVNNRSGVRKSGLLPIHVESPVPRADRRFAVLSSLGARPLMYQHRISQRRNRPLAERVHVYLDVSGSISPHLGCLCAAITTCSQYVFPRVHQFSTVVRDVTLAKIKAGLRETTFGTDITCVGEHMMKHRIRRAVIITDGFVGPVGAEHLEYFKSCHIGVALTPGHSTRHDLQQIARCWVELKDLSR